MSIYGEYAHEQRARSALYAELETAPDEESRARILEKIEMCEREIRCLYSDMEEAYDRGGVGRDDEEEE